MQYYVNKESAKIEHYQLVFYIKTNTSQLTKSLNQGRITERVRFIYSELRNAKSYFQLIM